jgi:hypothetical protein
MKIFGIILISILSTMILLALSNRWLPKWFCDHMGWHLAPKRQRFDGCSFGGECSRCGREVLQDSQGNWFSIERQ